MQQNLEDSQNQDNESATNTKDHILIVENILSQSEQILIQYKTEIDLLRNEINLMKNKVSNNNDLTKSSIISATDSLLRDLMMAVSCQKDENNRLQSHYTQVKKECYQIQELILQCIQKIAFLEEQVGNYK